VSVALFDAKPSTAVNPQANATQARTMEHYRRLGFADEVRAALAARAAPQQRPLEAERVEDRDADAVTAAALGFTAGAHSPLRHH
jgi:hypothetical protein